MHAIPTSVAVIGLGAVLVVAPTALPVATAHPVPPVVHDLTIPEVVGTGPVAPVVAARRVHGVRFDLAGVTFSAPPPAGTVVRLRTHDAGGWSDWSVLGLEGDGGGTRPGTDTVAAPGADAVDVRVTTPAGTPPRDPRLSLVDGGRSDADAVTSTPPGSAQASVTRPAIVSRASWGADESLARCTTSPLARYQAVVVHHTLGGNTYSAADVPALVRSLYAYQVRSLGYCDLGYQLVVDRFGRAYEGRRGSTSGFVEGAQATGFDRQTTGIAVLGDFTAATMPAAAVTTVSRLAAWEADRSLVDPSGSVTLTSTGGSRYAKGVRVTVPRIVGHRDLSVTGCPGDAAYTGALATIRSTTFALWRDGQWDPLPAGTAVETYTPPASSVFTLAGGGFGHGIGMSQWGAYGAATRGLTWQQILAFYYPGTSRTTQGDPTLRVWLSALGTASLRLSRDAGVVVSDGTRSTTLSTDYRWRLVPQGSGVTLQRTTGTTWSALTGWSAVAKPLTVSRPALGSVRVVLSSGAQRAYAGTIRVVPRSGAVYSINLVGFERYVRGVVPIEMSASWAPAALAAQAVAARTYAAQARATVSSTRLSDICDSTACQAYLGIADYSSGGTLLRRYEDARSTAATTATAGVVLTYLGKPAFTQFSASNGGRTVAGSQPYLREQDDPYDGVVASSLNTHSWTRSVSVARLQSAFPTVGTLRSVAVVARSGGSPTVRWGGRVESVTLTGSAGSTTVTGRTFTARLGLMSTWWTVASAPARSAAYRPRDVTGDRLPDVIAPSGSALRAIAYTGSMGFTTTQILGSGFAGLRAAAAVGPWTSDNLGDVMAIDAAGSAWYFPGLGRSGLVGGRYRLATGWSSVDTIVPVGDWDGDGHTDVVTRLTDGRLVLRRGDGAGHVVSSTTVASGWGALRQLTSADLTGDGRRDLVAVRPSDGSLLLYANSGTGGLRAPVLIGLYGWNAMSAVRGIGDLTGDGRDDLLARRARDGALLVYGGRPGPRLAPALRAGSSSATVWGG